jgi:hypothetical protein
VAYFRFNAFLDRHASTGQLFAIAAARRTEIIEYGVLHLNESAPSAASTI